MTSIRRTLTVRLLVWMGLLVLLAGGGLYVGIRGALLRQFDATLHARASMLQSGTKWDGTKVDVDFAPEAMPWYRAGPGAEYFEVELIGTLGSPPSVLVRAPAPSANPSAARWAEPFGLADGTFDLRLPDGRPGRVEIRVFRPLPEEDLDKPGNEAQRDAAKKSAPEVRLVVGMGRENLEGVLGVIGLGFLGAGVVLGVGLVVGVRRALASGLSPLESLSAQVRGIDADALSTRLEGSGLPDELRPIHGRLNELLERLEGAFARERRFTTGAAHELRTPVAELRALLEVSLSRERTAAERRATLGSALKVTLGMEDLVRALLTLARKGGEEGPAVEAIDPGPVIVGVVERHEDTAQGRGGGIERIGEGGALVSANRAVLESVLDNVMANAVEYASPAPRVVWRVWDEGGEVMIEVSNPAAGVGPGDVERFFEPFWRRSESRTDRRHLGMGLAVSRALAESMGGQLTAAIGADGIVRVRLTLRRAEGG